jgi:hypothetical protein
VFPNYNPQIAGHGYTQAATINTRSMFHSMGCDVDYDKFAGKFFGHWRNHHHQAVNPLLNRVVNVPIGTTIHLDQVAASTYAHMQIPSSTNMFYLVKGVAKVGNTHMVYIYLKYEDLHRANEIYRLVCSFCMKMMKETIKNEFNGNVPLGTPAQQAKMMEIFQKSCARERQAVALVASSAIVVV